MLISGGKACETDSVQAPRRERIRGWGAAGKGEENSQCAWRGVGEGAVENWVRLIMW